MSSSPPPSKQRPPKQRPPKQRPPKVGGLFSQFLEFFGMTPSAQSEYLNSQATESSADVPDIVWRCQSCHNPAQWRAKEERWVCRHHPHAKVTDQL